ncbi:MAG: glycoside hydrolase family 16 protein [Marinilabiliaceae bacterium]|nr:glycoside hydrolase family 16 protein [Marinilabiliaceae bacterium]
MNILTYITLIFAFIHFSITAQVEPDNFSQSQKNEMTLVWSDEFNIDGVPNSLNWNYETGFVRNEELQWYQPQNAYCKNGKLIIEGKKETITNPNYTPNSKNWRNNRKYAHFTSSCLITKELHEWESGGYFEIRAKIDTTAGAWPAIWILGTNDKWPFSGEIDIMEFYRINNNPTILANAVWGSNKHRNGTWDSEKIPLSHFTSKNSGWVNQFHIWSMHWDNEQIKIMVDDELLNIINIKESVNPNGKNPFTKENKHYLLLNLAIGANGGKPDIKNKPITFEVDYVRVYKKI